MTTNHIGNPCDDFGSLYPKGYNDTQKERYETTNDFVGTNADAFDIVKLLNLDGEGGLVHGGRLMRKLEELLGGDRRIEELSLRYHAVATDIGEQKEVWIRQGSLLEAIRDSIAIPMLFEPVRKNGMRLVDGGVLNL